MRLIVDMSNLDASRWAQVSGESGHAFSAHYSDQLDLWRTGQTLPMLWSEPIIRRTATDTLTLGVDLAAGRRRTVRSAAASMVGRSAL
jgi:penicillin amidase